MRRSITLIIVLSISLILSGCWNRKELNSFGIVIATAIDIDKNNEWVTSFQVVIPGAIATQTGGAGAQAPITVFSTRGSTINEAYLNASRETPRKLFLSHNRVLILSERAAKKGVKQIMDFLIRNVESRETMYIVLTRENVRNLLEILLPVEKIPGNAIKQILEGEKTILSITKPVKFIEFASAQFNPTTNAFLPEVIVSGNENKQRNLEAIGETKSDAVLKVDGLGVFQDGKLKDWIHREDSIGISFLTDSVDNAVIDFTCNENKKNSSFTIEKSSTKKKPHIRNGELFMDVEINAKGTLTETACKEDFSNPTTLKKMEKNIRKEVIKDVERGFNRAKELNTDLVGFGDSFHKKHPQKWKKLEKDWDHSFSTIKMNVSVHVEINRTGLMKESFSKAAKP
ncbi:Ger(x)C family spore germination protein [Bacillus sp. 03113]|uniref:Ger(x)C family spore germination protein n=1 Tax=Bacillus sp. 03113 TaxID=2578211 RepID=UPI0011449962|nr:Ger(x)C family spore germination protein [Bacillus sp. 03113]